MLGVLSGRWRDEGTALAIGVTGFAVLYWFPIDYGVVGSAAAAAVELAHWYVREHFLLCLIPALFIAGALAAFLRRGAIMKYLQADANPVVAYAVASVSGALLAVCSCTVLPLFAGISRMGAGIGPGAAFLYSGPAINVLAIVLTASVLGPEMGIARGVGAVVFSLVIGLAMQALFGSRGQTRPLAMPESSSCSAARTVVIVAAMVAILVFANWNAADAGPGFFASVQGVKWYIVAGSALILGAALRGTPRKDLGEWIAQSWGFAKQIVPLLLAGVLIAGALLGSEARPGLIPSGWIAGAVGGNSLAANAFAAIAGAFMYFATLTEVPIVLGLLDNGMGKGPALALLLAGPAVSLPNMLALAGIMGWRRTAAYIVLVVAMATASGYLFGTFFS